ncbi:glycosyltransferase family 2 protein, partial [Patescibacteria group bacterium]|nr:glycosyltransferase family 2 protein [Patescibacteria group bacterium]
MIDYSIVIPVYNEEARATKTLTQVLSFMNSFAPAFEIIVVDDGSKDKTAETVEAYIQDHPEIKLIKNEHKGKGPTVRTGVLAATGKYIYTIDCDLSTPMDELKRLANWITDNNYDIVIASREGLGANREGEPFYRHLLGRVFNYWVQALVLKGIRDSQCGFKLYKNQVAKAIFSNLIVYGEDSKKLKTAFLGAFDVEVLFIARINGYKIK